jgi:hypothetical protein
MSEEKKEPQEELDIQEIKRKQRVIKFLKKLFNKSK